MEFFTIAAICVVCKVGYTLLDSFFSVNGSEAKPVKHTPSPKIDKCEQYPSDEPTKKFCSTFSCFSNEYVSYSRIATYCSCPQKFKIIYLDKLSPSSSFDFRYSKGITLHKTLENYFQSQIGTVIKEINYKEIIDSAITYKYFQPSSSHNCRLGESQKKQNKIFTDNVRFICKSFPKNVKIIAVEQELKFEMNGISFLGIVDLIVRHENGELEIIDYKTGKIRPVKEQLQIYAIPFFQKENCKTIHYRFICVDRQSHFKWSEDSDALLISSKNILRMVNTMLDDRSFYPINDKKCKGCSVSHYCEFFKNGKYTTQTLSLINLTPTTKHQEWKDPTIKPKKILNKTSILVKCPYKLVKAIYQCKCSHTKKVIQCGEIHFSDKCFTRLSIAAFKELYPNIYGEFISDQGTPIAKIYKDKITIIDLI